MMIILVALLFGHEKPLRGAILGCGLTPTLYFLFQSFQIKSFAISTLVGFSLSFGSAYFISMITSGFKGGNHNTGPSYMGGGSGPDSGFEGGIVQSDQERKKQKK